MKTAVVLFNLGGPDSPEAVRPFLQNLFSDPAIIRVPGFVRGILARVIAARRAPIAREIYGRIGGRSPILGLTEAQARALEAALHGVIGEARVFIAMRYWHPFAAQTAQAVKAYAPDRIVLLPLYPQYSTTTSASSLADWDRAAAREGLTQPTHRVCCYPVEQGFIAAQAALIAEQLAKVPGDARYRVLFSAHGLPERVVKAGDPYQYQVEQSAKAIAAALSLPGLDWRVTYQSRVGPLKWIGPATDDEIRVAGREGLGLIVVPVAFVSEHSETLVELDLEYGHLAAESGVPFYLRVPAVGTTPLFIDGLARLVARAVLRPGLCSFAGGRYCPAPQKECPQQAA